MASLGAQAVPKVPAGQYKRVHQRALALVEGGRAADALAYLDRCEERLPGDAEHEFLRAIAHASGGDGAAAAVAMARALDRGMPFGRFVAGPRDRLGSLYERPEYRRRRAAWLAVGGGLVHGPMLGAITDRAVRVWVRVVPDVEPVSVQAGLAASGPGAEPWPIRAAGVVGGDHTAVAALTGLRPASRYRYRVRIGDRTVASGEFRTMPARGPGRFRIAFGGGSGYVPAHERAWDTVGAEAPDALLLLGDNVYIDAPESPAMQRFCYYRRQSQPAFRRLVGRVPVFSIWDDHDFTTNDGRGGRAIDRPAWKRPVWEVFRQNWVNPGYGGGAEQPGCWYSFALGDVDFFMLDGRYYRENPARAQPSMLGPAQKRWLLDAILRSRATFKVLCSPVPWTLRAKGASKDTWNGYRAERDEIFAFLAARCIDGVVLLSADRHRSDLWRIERPGGYPLWEFNSSRLTNQHVHPTMKAAEFSYNAKQSFGTVDFDTRADDPSVTYRIVTIDGEEVFARTVRASQIRHD